MLIPHFDTEVCVYIVHTCSYQMFCIVRVMYIGSVYRLAKPRTIEQVCKQQEDHVLDEDNWERILVANLLFALLASIWGVGGAVYLARAVKKVTIVIRPG